ncbi:unnamed protein product [Linum trigynum]|uniref:Uncharacterized protein n=1 Tax=Linum trigynum TaxID=586398 RepID=A0AAV2EAZ1_9ROSI
MERCCKVFSTARMSEVELAAQLKLEIYHYRELRHREEEKDSDQATSVNEKSIHIEHASLRTYASQTLILHDLASVDSTVEDDKSGNDSKFARIRSPN